MRILALVSHLDRPSVRYRIQAYRPFLRDAGAHLDVRAWPGGLAGWRLLGGLGKWDGVIVQRKLFGSWLLGRLRHFCRYFVFDFDDAIYGNDSYHGAGLANERRTRAFARMVRAADLVLAGNEHLRQQAAFWTSLDKVLCLPTCVDPTRYHTADHTAATLVWIGTSSTLQGLEQIRPLLNEVGRNSAVRLKVICDRGLELDDLPVDFVPWRERDEADELASADIGISWLPDDSWSQGKCGLKVLQYMAAGLPVVANPVGVQRDMVRHGENGFLAETPAQWREAIHRLASDAPLRRRMGLAGRRRLEADYSVTRGAGIWLKVLKRMAQPATR